MPTYDGTLSALNAQADSYAAMFLLDPNSKNDGEWDAFRHAYASAEMTRRFGATIADTLGIWNETKGDYTYNQSPAQKNMDL